jgi:hypothetical protein
LPKDDLNGQVYLSSGEKTLGRQPARTRDSEGPLGTRQIARPEKIVLRTNLAWTNAMARAAGAFASILDHRKMR